MKDVYREAVMQTGTKKVRQTGRRTGRRSSELVRRSVRRAGRQQDRGKESEEGRKAGKYTRRCICEVGINENHVTAK